MKLALQAFFRCRTWKLDFKSSVYCNDSIASNNNNNKKNGVNRRDQQGAHGSSAKKQGTNDGRKTIIINRFNKNNNNNHRNDRRTGMAQMRSTTIVPGRERFATVKSSPNSSPFAANYYAVNPGLSGIFPWLAPQAVQWEKYKFLSMKIHYISQVNEFNTNSNGLVGILFDPNPSDGAPTDMTTLINHSYAKALRPTEDFTINVPKQVLERLTAGFLVRNRSKRTDLNTYDVGAIYIAATGQVDNTTELGYFEIEYRVQLLQRQTTGIGQTLVNNIVYHVARDITAQQVLTSGVPVIFQPAVAYPTFTPQFATYNNGVFTMLEGIYRLDFNVTFINSLNAIISCAADVAQNAVQVGQIYNGLSISTNPYASITITGTVYVNCADGDTLAVNVLNTENAFITNTNVFGDIWITALA